MTVSSWAATDTTPYTYVYAGKTITVPIAMLDGVRVNDRCADAPERCSALKALNGASRVGEIRHTKNANFSGAYCKILKGTQLFMHDEEQHNAQFCVFKDLTMVDARELYRRHILKAKKGGKP